MRNIRMAYIHCAGDRNNQTDTMNAQRTAHTYIRNSEHNILSMNIYASRLMRLMRLMSNGQEEKLEINENTHLMESLHDEQ